MVSPGLARSVLLAAGVLLLEGCLLDGNGALLVTSCVDDADCPAGALCNRGVCTSLDASFDAGPGDAGRDAAEDAAPVDAMAADSGPDSGSDDGGLQSPLLAYADAEFVRPSPATYFDRVSTAFFTYEVDEPRLLEDGSVYIEGERTNLLVGSESVDGWQVQGSTATADAVAAPNGTITAVLWDVPDSPAARLFIVAPPWGGAARPRAALSLFATAPSGSEVFRQYWRSGGIDQHGPDRTVTSSWQRFSESHVDMERHGVAQASEPSARTLAVWGFQAEVAAFASQYIPTVSAVETRAAEVLTFVATPSPMLESRWTVNVAPEASSSSFVIAGESWTIFQFASPDDALVLDSSGGTARICVELAGARHVCSAELSFDADQPLAITVDPGLGRLTVAGATAGNGPSDATPWSFPPGALRVGSASDGTQAYFGRIGAPLGS